MTIHRIIDGGPGGFTIHADDGCHCVPAGADATNYHYREAMAWLAAGGVMEPVPPEVVEVLRVQGHQIDAAATAKGPSGA